MQEEDHGILLESIEKFTEGMVNPKHMFKGRHIVQDRYGEKMVLMVAMIVHSFFTTVVNLNWSDDSKACFYPKFLQCCCLASSPLFVIAEFFISLTFA